MYMSKTCKTCLLRWRFVQYFSISFDFNRLFLRWYVWIIQTRIRHGFENYEKKRVLIWLCKVSFVTKQKRNDMNVFQKKEPKQNKQYYQKKTNNTKILYQKKCILQLFWQRHASTHKKASYSENLTPVNWGKVPVPSPSIKVLWWSF